MWNFWTSSYSFLQNVLIFAFFIIIFSGSFHENRTEFSEFRPRFKFNPKSRWLNLKPKI